MSSKLICLTLILCLCAITVLVSAGKSGHGNIILHGCHGKTILTGGGKNKDGGNIILKENCHHETNRHVTNFYPIWGWHGGWHGGYGGENGGNGGGFGGFGNGGF